MTKLGYTVVVITTIICCTSAQNAAIRLPATIFAEKSCASLPPTELTTSDTEKIDQYLTSRYGPLCGGQGWTRVAYLNIPNDDTQCPSGWTKYTSPVRACGRDLSSSISYSVQGQSYNHVCGRITAIQRGRPNGFGPAQSERSHEFDGIGIWHGSSFEDGYIWSFVNAPEIQPSNERYGCPCAYSDWPYLDDISQFIGSKYFCNTGNIGTESAQAGVYYTDNPLWTGSGCTSNNTCCTFNNPPWFFAGLSNSTTDSIEVEVYLNGPTSQEDIVITEIEIYIQ